jgi:hypothetical protein
VQEASLYAAHPIPFDDSRSNPTRQKATSHRSARCGWAGPRLRRGRRSARCQRATRRRHPAFLCSIQGGRDLQPIYEARRPLLWPMRNCRKKAPGDTSRRYPHLRQFQGVGQKSQEVDGETWYFTHCHLVGFRVSGNPIIINLAAHLVLAGTGDEIRYERILHF